MSEKKINFCYLYPDSFNLHGDRGNVFAFEKTAKLLNIEFNFQRINHFNDPIDFDRSDLIFISPGELRTCEGVSKLIKNQADGFKNYIKNGKTMIVVGTTIALFAKETIKINGDIFKGLKLVDSICRERKNVYSNDVVYKMDFFDDMPEIVGGQIQMLDVILNGETSLGNVSYGYGNSHQKDEGIIKQNFYFTNALGPVFVKNPWFAARIMINIMNLKNIWDNFDMPEFSLEKKSNDEIRKFIHLKTKKYDVSRFE